MVKSQPPKQRNLFNLTNRNGGEKRNGEEEKWRRRETEPREKNEPNGGGEGGFIWQFFRRNYRQTLIVVGGIKFHR